MAYPDASEFGGVSLVVWLPLFLLAMVVVYGFRPLELWRLAHIPGPTPTWLIGNIREINKVGAHRLDLFYPQQYTPIFKIFMGARSIVVVEKPELARHVARQCSNRPNFFGNSPSAKDRGEGALVWTTGKLWRSLRNSWQPMFFSGSLMGYFPSMMKGTQFLLDELREAATNGDCLNIHTSLGELTFTAIASVAFGVDLHIQKADKTISANEERDKRLCESASCLFGPINGSIYDMLGAMFPFLVPILRFLARFAPDEPLRVISRARRTLDSLIKDLFAEHRAALAEASAAGKTLANPIVTVDGIVRKLRADDTNSNDKAAAEGEPRKGCKPGSFIDLLIRGNDKSRNGAGFTDEMMVEQVLSALITAYETTANTMAFACYCLALPRNREKLEKLLAEIDAFGRQREPTIDDLDELPYLNAVLKESMRMLAAGHTTFRVAEQDMDLAGFAIKKGQWMSIPIHHFQNSAKYWDAPEIFMPERWFKPLQTPAAYMPWGEGARMCVGTPLALKEVKLTLLCIFQRFWLELAPTTLLEEPLELMVNVTLAPKNGIHVRPIPRS